MSKYPMPKPILHIPPSVTADTVIFTIIEDKLKVLLIKRSNLPFAGSWALPGGFARRNESTEKAAMRVLKDKAGLVSVYLEQLYTFDEAGRDPRGHVLTVAYFALVDSGKIKFAGAAQESATFFDMNKLPPLAFDHKRIISYALQRLRYKLEYTNAIANLLPPRFTLSQLQRAYEIILGRKLDKRNFRKKFLAIGLIKPTKAKLSGISHRPAQLFVFAKEGKIELKRFF